MNKTEAIIELIIRAGSFAFMIAVLPLIFGLGCLGFVWVTVINTWEMIS
jgi:hypothetical protein